MNNNNAILHAYMAGGKLYGYSFAKSQFFPTTKKQILILLSWWLNNIEKVPPTQSQIKVVNNPTILIKSDEIHVINQVLDTQNCP